MPVTNQAAIFLPVLALVLLTLIAFVRLAAGRTVAAKDPGFDPGYYKAHLGEAEPEAGRVPARHWDNLFEFPTLIYAACLTAFVMGAVGVWTLVFAWGFVIARVAQSAIHMSYNNTAHRAVGFVLGLVMGFALWLNVAISIFAAL
ncbi:MAPEG family protein [Novosphingobium aquimarinum]|uniref:MAPEG family protein n=1 Tax=Novosphingobium aquimarinum TaxID=2682494 RepID=UPI0012EC1828|nr:MAPEG family protein [Novosphingobium aquimarinum]